MFFKQKLFTITKYFGIKMDANKNFLLNFLSNKQQLSIPIYQRKYSWKEKECKQLWDDIIRVGSSPITDETHFVGSIVYMKINPHMMTPISELLVIDGQQRITTVSLLISAIASYLKKEPVENLMDWQAILNYYLINDLEKGEKRYKFLLTAEDKNTLIKIIDNIQSDEDIMFTSEDSQNIINNYQLFEKWLNKDNIELAYIGLTRLLIIYIALEQGKDNPQLIFESLNSTGLELNQTDLIRNYILMGLEPDEQEKLYNNYWLEIEKGFENNHDNLFDNFIRHYLTIKLKRIPKIKEIYLEFKQYSKDFNHVEDLVKDIYKYAQYYFNFVFEKEENLKLRNSFKDLNELNYDVTHCFMLELYNDYYNEKITTDIFIKILDLIQSYLVRRQICNIPANSLNKTFAGLHDEINSDDYFNSFKFALIEKDIYKRFPNTSEFKENLQMKDIYNSRIRAYILRKLENYESKEPINVESFTIEHIMPQNPNLSDDWKFELGANWEEVQKTYLHTLGNLTLTGYNSELSDRPFLEKRDIEGGFASSPLNLNKDLRTLSNWNENEIKKRAQKLSEIAIKVWQYPRLDKEIIAKYKKEKEIQSEMGYTLDDFQYLKENPKLKELFIDLSEKINEISDIVKMEPKKRYIAFKHRKNFVDIIPLKNELKLILNMNFSDIEDPKSKCRDITDIGSWGNGNIEFKIDSNDDFEYGLYLIQQSFESNLEDYQLKHLKYWEMFKAEIASKYPEIKIKPSGHYANYDFIKIKNITITLSRNTNSKENACKFYIYDNKELFDYLNSQKDEIEKKIGYKLNWNREYTPKLSVIQKRIKINNKNEKYWNKSIDWHLKTAIEFKDVLIPIFENFKKMKM